MNCESIRPKLDRFLSEELPETERGEVEKHLAGCGACRADAAAAEQWRRLMRSAGKRFSTSPQFRKRIEEQYASDRTRR